MKINPKNYAVKCAAKSMEPLNELIYSIIHENDEFSQDFIDEMAKAEEEDFIDVDDLDDLFL